MVSENHLCYVQPIKERRQECVMGEDDDEDEEEAREGTFSFMFFDFEAMPLEDKHVVNLAVAMKVCDECEEEWDLTRECRRCGYSRNRVLRHR